MKIRKTQKTEMTLSLILQFNLRLGSYSIWSASTSRTTYEGKDPGLEHLIASMQPRKYSKDYSKHSMGSKPGQLPGWWIPEALDALDEMEETWKLLDAMRLGELRSLRSHLPEESQLEILEDFQLIPTELHLHRCPYESLPPLVETPKILESLETLREMFPADYPEKLTCSDSSQLPGDGVLAPI
jgi:hypothetical protein